jgi:hypothetical protein
MADYYVFKFVPLVLLEALTLVALKWGTPRRCLIDSLLMNTATFLGLMLSMAPNLQSGGITGLALFCVYSTIVEGVILTLLERHGPEKIWTSVLAANVAGCVFLWLLSLFGNMLSAK